MIIIDYSAQDFSPQYTLLQGANQLNIEWNDVIWAALSVGKLGLDDLIAHGQFSVDEMRFRYYLIYSHLMQEGDKIIKSPL